MFTAEGAGMSKTRENLSDRRGNALGVALLKIMLKTLGINFTCRFVWVITLFYVLFDRRARKQSSYYLKHRFPQDRFWKRLFHTWALFTHLGQSLLQAVGMKYGCVRFENLHLERYKEKVTGQGGAVFLCSHFGSWQGMMGMIGVFDRKICILAKPDRNRNVNKDMAVDGFGDKIVWISTEGAMGGLLDVYDHLASGDLVCIMGDRSLENDSVRVQFMREEAAFPLAAFQIAHQAQVPVFPVFSYCRDGRHDTITLDIMEPVTPSEGARRRNRISELEQYTSILEDMADKYPFECYIFENIWSKHETT
ncbi:MAG: hypothetical protein E7045_04720 [Lentisphaerae bacterium]|nr:hypothetical protein [Lentisphaerota bacterium]